MILLHVCVCIGAYQFEKEYADTTLIMRICAWEEKDWN